MKTSIVIIILSLSFSFHIAHAVPADLQNLFDRMSNNNPEIKLSQLNSNFSEESLRGSKSRLWPSLSYTIGVSKSDDGSVPTGSTDFNTGTSSPGGSLPSSSNSSVSSVNDLSSSGSYYSGQVSMSYFLFTQFAISQDILRSENSLKSANIGKNQVQDEKEAQFTQLILEWQFLKKIEPKLIEAQKIVNKMKKHKKRRSNFLYTQSDNVTMGERLAKLNYEITRVKEGKKLVFSAIEALLPNINENELNDLRELELDYDLPSDELLAKLYKDQGRSYKKSELEIESAKAYRKSAEWNRPWVPIVYVSAGYSHSGDFEDNNSEGTSASLLMNFNIFDGNYSSARRQQSRIAVKMAKEKHKLTTSSKILYLKHERMKAEVAKSEYKVKEAVSKQKEMRMKDVKRKIRQGIGTNLELSASTLDWVSSQMDALKTLKKYQQAVANVAVEINEWGKVIINEKD